MTANSTGGVYSGLLGATTHGKKQVTSDTGESFSTEIYRSINVADDADVFRSLMNGELHQVDCPFTDATYDLAVPVAIHDPGRRVFALFVPPQLRWNEIELRKRLLDELESDTADLPAYVRNFSVVLDPSAVGDLAGADASALDAREAASPDEVTQVATKPDESLAAAKELARKRAEVEAEQRKLETEKRQLDEVRDRFDREREQMDELQEKLQSERDALAKERQQLQAQQLNAEQHAISESADVSSDESTQVVTDDQFIEVVDLDEFSLAQAESVVMVDVDEVVVETIDLAADVPDKMSELVSSTQHKAVKIAGDRVLALAQIERDELDELFADPPTFFVQLHDTGGYPLVTLLLARLDERQQATASAVWILDVADDEDRKVLEKLRERSKLRAAFYGPTGNRMRAVEVAAPFEANIAWILERADELLDKSPKSDFEGARDEFLETDETLGTMRHNFTADSFSDAKSPSDVKLAAGIVGYWSKPDTFEYLVANRCFPLEQFRAIQSRVARRAADAGIFLNDPLRELAVEIGISKSEENLVELLLANFAEASISIRENDLEPAEQWENWDALLGLGEQLGLPPDPDVVELAEVSLRRAQEAEELMVKSDEFGVGPTIEEPRKDASDSEGSLIVAKRSESTGITYFLPNDAVLDTFDDLATMDRDDLELLLNDANGRLEASQMLIERFGSSGMSKVMETAENMNAPEVAALAKFLESKAGGLEAELVRCVESGGPSGAYVAARALAKVKSTTAIPALMNALQDPERKGDKKRFAEALAAYGDKLLPSLTRAIKRDGPDDSLVTLLVHLEDEVDGTLSNLSKDRSKNLREAARLAREQRESKSA